MKFKKIATVLGSALMVGSTIGLAAAAAYPTPFVKDGMANVAIVLGTNGAAQSDMVAVTDITKDLAGELAGQSVGGVTTVTGGDSFLLEDGSTKLNLGSTLDIADTLNDEDMETFLASGKYKDTNRTETTYDQSIDVAPEQVIYSSSTYYQDKVPFTGVLYEKGDEVLSYSIDLGMDDFTLTEGTDLPLLNNEYYVLSATATELVLLDSSASATIALGESKTLDVDGSSYEVSVDYVGSSSAKLVVNGETTDSISEGESYELDDGSWIAVKDVLSSNKDSVVDRVEFTIGTGKIELKDGNKVKINGKSTDGITADLSSEGTITLDWTAPERTFLAKAGDEIVMPGFNALKVIYGGIDFPTAETTSLSADNILTLETSVKDGPLSLILLDFGNYNVTNSNFTDLGESADSNLVLSDLSDDGNISLTSDDYFAVSYISNSGKEFASYAFKLSEIDEIEDESRTEVTLENLAGGDNIVLSKVGRTATRGKIKFELLAANETDDEATIAITSSDDGTNAILTADSLVTAKGMVINLTGLEGNTSLGAMEIVFNEADEEGVANSAEAFTVTLGNYTDSIEVSSVAAGDNGKYEEETARSSKVYEGYVYSPLATMYTHEKPTDGAKDFKVSYFGEEVSAKVYVASASATTAEGSDSIGTLLVMDNEASKMTGKNLIVIGGNCVNSVAADLLGLTVGGANCGADFSAKTGVVDGGYLIKSFDAKESGKVALLVAGYSALDTGKARTYLINHNVETTVGAGVKGTTATEATVITA